MKTNTGVFVSFMTKRESNANTLVILRFFDELFDVINEDPF